MARISEGIFAAYFFYVALLACVRKPEVALGALLVAGGFALLVLVARRLSQISPHFEIARDWLPVIYTLVAYREMNWFSPATRDYHFEKSWIVWDHRLLSDSGWRSAIESTGWLLPGYLEFCYALVYATCAISVAMFYLADKRDRVDDFLAVYAVGTLLSYALFPFFPSDPPRVVFPDADVPQVMTPLREFNLFVVGSYGIHSSVFPSAHVSSVFACAWGLMFLLHERPWLGRAMMLYASSVSVATVYGRYHYAADAVAGAVIGLASLALAIGMRARRRPRLDQSIR